ncbi:winged helix-turn-helix domain-containing protein [Methanolobus zinderi]|uniref:Winged helix-turn-helix domain-containing protein n=1 Tax=Methanolobus zinderi TaxID=536044 RepID=A0A7D5J7F7_9EURY|nr:winged helix-turn-helix domain-containing protein [Methanolobus zinderi]QLC49010.1 winged helix-turn-helix domain-containing protein [Methanolobus zinderi]
MKRALQDVVFASEKRKNVLLLLQDGPKKMDTLLNAVDTNRQSLLPQLRILEEHHLIDHYDDTYELTTMGKLVIDETAPSIELMEFLDTNIDYWGTRNLDFIPSILLSRIKELGNCRIVNPTVTELHEMDKEFSRAAEQSESLYGVTNYFHPNFPGLFSKMAEKGLKVHFILSEDLADKLHSENYGDFNKLLKNNLFSFSVYPGKLNVMSFMFHDNHLMMHMLDKKEKFDNKYILCENEEAIYWANELFEYYEQKSRPISEHIKPDLASEPLKT